MIRRRWQKAKRTFEAANDRSDSDRDAFVGEACQDDESLTKRVESFLEEDNRENNFLDVPTLSPTPSSLPPRHELPNDGLAAFPNQKIDSYKIIRKIGAGGMGDVYLAEDAELKRQVALKLLPTEFTRDKARVRRFQQEARAVSQLNHPNILTIHKIGQTNQIHYIVTEFVDGCTLRQCLAQSMTLCEMLDVITQIASALKAAHEAKIVHRDIKPENVMVRRDGYVKVLDFGLAKLVESQEVDLIAETDFQTQPGVVMGTPSYMSPEQIEGEHVDGRTDLFSLGSLLYECLTGKQAFTGTTMSEVITQVIRSDPQAPSKLNPDVPPELDFIVLKLLRKKPDERYQTADELIADLREINSKIQSGGGFATKVLPRKKDTSSVKALDTFSQIINKSPVSLLLIASVVVVGLFAYFWLTSKSVVAKPEALKLFNGGTESLRDGTYYKASKMLEDAVKIDPNFALAHARLAEAWMELDYVGRAQNELLKVNGLQREQQSFFPAFSQSDDSLYINAIEATVVRDFPKAVAFYQTIAERHPQEPHAFLDLGRAYEKNEEADKAIESYEKAANLNPQYGAAFLRLGVLRSRKAEYAGADEAFNRAEKIYDRLSNDEGMAEVKYQRGVSFNVQEKLDLAREQFQQVMNIPRATKHQQIRSILQISSTFYSEGKTAPAKEYAASAIKLAKEERMETLATNGLIDLGNAFLYAKAYDEAERHFQEALESARKDNQPRNEARASLSLATLYIQQNKPEEARIFAEQALPFYQKGDYGIQAAQANLILGQANELRKDYDGALRAYREVTQSDTSLAVKASAHMSMGYMLKLQENYPQALRSFEESYVSYQSLNNQYLTAYALLYLSETLCYLGRFEEAKEKSAKAETVAKDAKLLTEFHSSIHLQNASIFLSERNFVKAIDAAKQAQESTDSNDLFEANRIIGLAQSGQNPKDSIGVQSCLQALQHAERKKDAKKINAAKLALAETYLNSGKNEDALKIALQAKDYFASAGQLESGWRAWAIAARASKASGDGSNARAFANNAFEMLAALRRDWSENETNIYLVKPEVQTFLEQLKTIES